MQTVLIAEAEPDFTGPDMAATADPAMQIADALAGPGYIVLEGAAQTLIPPALLCGLARVAAELEDEAFRSAMTGRIHDGQHNRLVRTDRINWIDGSLAETAAYLGIIDELRLALNQQLFLGLFEYECHFARYDKGAYYKRHRDAFVGERNRLVTTILYLNQNWQPEDGGQLLVWSENGTDPLFRVEPVFGTLVMFLSELFPHEVLPANRSRLSLTGWLRLNREGSF
ncbi:MAG: 2OG-Fe(II) oxygenase [Pseudomonadales bacterium]|nr:2OG-Fe(II) oxygenase [Pseudomonadales bacterium]